MDIARPKLSGAREHGDNCTCDLAPRPAEAMMVHGVSGSNACHGPQAPLLGVSSDLVPPVVYQTVEHRWKLWWPCEACGGVALPLRGGANAGGSNSTRLALALQLDDQPCPACETRRKTPRAGRR
jgi:hypothetical protein